MILQGNQRGGARDLALHLLKDENEHVEVHELRGFVSENLVSALNEVYAVSRGTKARQFLYSLSLNPPKSENVTINDFEEAVEQVEDRLGLSGQPRAIVFHEKNGRRHAHAVWSRIDTVNMKAIELPYTKLKLKEISRELYLKHDWEMPAGFLDSRNRDPRNFTLQQWQQARRIGKDPRQIKKDLQDCWAISDTQASFQQALKERGYWLARGDRRGVVVLDHRCEVFAVAKWVGIKAKQVRAKIPDPDKLPSVTDARGRIAETMAKRLGELANQQAKVITGRLDEIETQRVQMASRHRQAREKLRSYHEERQVSEVKQRQDRYNRGLRGLLDRFTGKHKKIKQINEQETLSAALRDRDERDSLVFSQLEERRTLQARIERLKRFNHTRSQEISFDKQAYAEIKRGQRETVELHKRSTSRTQRWDPEPSL